jgi:hypothetical protein
MGSGICALEEDDKVDCDDEDEDDLVCVLG